MALPVRARCGQKQEHIEEAVDTIQQSAAMGFSFCSKNRKREEPSVHKVGFYTGVLRSDNLVPQLEVLHPALDLTAVLW